MDEKKPVNEEAVEEPTEAELPAAIPAQQDWQKRHDDREAYREELRTRVRKAQPNAAYFRPAKPKPTISDDTLKSSRIGNGQRRSVSRHHFLPRKAIFI